MTDAISSVQTGAHMRSGEMRQGEVSEWQKNQEFDILGFELFRKKLVLCMASKRESLLCQMRKFELNSEMQSNS